MGLEEFISNSNPECTTAPDSLTCLSPLSYSERNRLRLAAKYISCDLSLLSVTSNHLVIPILCTYHSPFTQDILLTALLSQSQLFLNIVSIEMSVLVLNCASRLCLPTIFAKRFALHYVFIHGCTWSVTVHFVKHTIVVGHRNDLRKNNFMITFANTAVGKSKRFADLQQCWRWWWTGIKSWKNIIIAAMRQ